MAIASEQPVGLDAPEPIGPFLNGAFPAQTPQSGGAWQLVDAFPNLTFEEPMFLQPVPGTSLLLLAEKDGELVVFEDDAATTSSTELIDFSHQVERGGDSGFFSFAFHPEFGQAGSPNAHFLYIYYRYTPDTDEGDKAYCRLSRLTWDPAEDSIDPASEFVLIQQYDRQGWHNGGGLFFGDDGFLYLTIGDEGGANDLFGSTQKMDLGLHSGVFRIDVDRQGEDVSHPIRRQPQSPDTPPPGWPGTFSQGYYIPNDNPWQDPGGSVLEEYWALGTRSPHRMTLDRPTGDIYLADVGQWAREEVSLVTAGANLQWPYREGSIGGPKPKPDPLIGTDLPPLFDYDGNDGDCVIGGYVYRGQMHAPALTGKYIYGDYTTAGIWAATRSGATVTRELLLSGPFGPQGLTGFGLDAEGEIYALSQDNATQGTGKIHKLVTMGPATPEPPPTLSGTGAFDDLASLTPTGGLIPYRVNSPLWSDGAEKQRWIATPNDGAPDTAGEQIAYSESGNWEFPPGTVIVKQFTLEGRRLETRFLVRGSDGAWYAVTYRWREDGSDADLLLGGEEDTIDIGGRSHRWSFPSRADCFQCHTSSQGRVLGLRTHQLNGDHLYPVTGRTANQLRTLNGLGLLSPPLDESGIPGLLSSAALDDDTASVGRRARSYLDSNCAHCHNPDEGIRDFDFRLTTPLELAGVLNAPVQSDFGIEGAREVAPGDAWRSLAWIRQNTNDLGQRMPPLGRHGIDTEAVNILYQWIESLPAPTAPTLPAGLAAYLPFEEGSGATAGDASGGGNDGEFVGGASWVVGRTGPGAATDGGTGLVRVGHSPGIHLGAGDADFTVAFWVNLQEDSTGSWRGLAGKGTTYNQRAIGIYLRPDSNRMEISISTAAHYNEGISSSHRLSAGAWTHLAVTKEGPALRLYVDGELDREGTLSGPAVGTVEDFHLGRAAGGAANTDALYDSLHLYGRALDATEIQGLAAADDTSGTPPDPRPLFDDAAAAAGLAGDDALPGASPFGDGLANIVKYAFNLDLSRPDSHWMVSGGSSGLPVASLAGGGQVWRMEYVRRRGSGLVYSPMKSTRLEGDTFVPMTGTETVTAIDPDWERVVIEEPLVEARLFAKVDVALP